MCSTCGFGRKRRFLGGGFEEAVRKGVIEGFMAARFCCWCPLGVVKEEEGVEGCEVDGRRRRRRWVNGEVLWFVMMEVRFLDGGGFSDGGSGGWEKRFCE